MTGDRNAARRDSRRDLYVVFEIEPAPESGCPLSGFDGEIEEIRQQLLDDECHTDTTVRTTECACPPNQECTEVVYATSDVEASCPCAVFGRYQCVPKLVDVTDGQILVETHLPNRERLTELVDALREAAGGLRLRKIKRIDTGDAERSRNTAVLDLFEVTEKQREAVTKAVAAGYYSSPRETSLGELADDLGISPSALSQRLNAVESKLATAAFAQASAQSP